jgi:hypothetical protein
MFHLNDSSEEKGSGKDRHARIGHGNIWGDGSGDGDGSGKGNGDGSGSGDGDGWKTIIKYASTHNYPVVIERHSNSESLEEITHILKK